MKDELRAAAVNSDVLSPSLIPSLLKLNPALIEIVGPGDMI
jgi:hypothetical protein